MDRDRTPDGASRLLVMSGGTWIWMLALLQVGHNPDKIDLWCGTERSKRNLDSLMKQSPVPLKAVTALSEVKPTESMGWQLVIMECGDELITGCPDVVRAILRIGLKWTWSGSKVGLKQLQNWTQGLCVGSRAVTHAQLAGATKARVMLCWNLDPNRLVTLGKVKYPTRPSGDWIKLAAPLEFRARQSATLCWDSSEKKLFPWPFPKGNAAVAVPSVFYPDGRTVVRSLAACEKAQLLDLPPHWTPDTVEAIWGWNDGKVVPLRIPVEFLLSGTAWYNPGALLDRNEDNPQSAPAPENKNVLTDWVKVANAELDTPKFAISQTGWLWEPGLGTEVTVATKGDEAGVDTTQWAVGGQGKEEARKTIRNWLLTRWRLNLTREALNELRRVKEVTAEESTKAKKSKRPPLCTDPRFRKAIVDCVRRSSNASWWEWADGSTLFFWRWPQEWQEAALKGARAFHTSRPPKRLTARTVPVESPEQAALLVEKVRKLITRRYIRPASEEAVWCVIPFFVVAKGEFDIRVVWSDTENGVNPSIAAPTFFMPLPDTLFRRVPNDAYIGDLDVGEMFHNFPLHPSEQVYAGIRLSEEQAKALGVESTLFVWDRLLFGWRPSPYFSVRMMTRAVEFAQGDTSDRSNPFAWDEIQFNLPGQPDYDPGKPWVMKWRTWDGVSACEVVFFVDDGRIIGPNEYLVQKATRQIASHIQYLGIQDASRKRRPVSQRPGAWAGTVVFTDCNLARKFVTQKKWDKAKTMVDWMSTKVNSNLGMPYKELLSYRGFLVHVSLTYPFMKPYLKGLHLTVESWRPKYQTPEMEGWPDPKFDGEDSAKVEHLLDDSDLEEESMLEDSAHSQGSSPRSADPNQPTDNTLMMAVPRLGADLAALKELLATEKPAMIPLRPINGRINYAYGFVDASGSGFGGTWRELRTSAEDTPAVEARHGFWCTEISEQSSNYREFRNLVEHVEEQSKSGNLTGKEVWVFTDNMVTEMVVFTGTSKSPTLFELVLRLRTLERDGQFVLRVVHVAGTRMIHEGTDGLSRGQVDVSQLTDRLASQVPLQLSAFERSDKLRGWLDCWVGKNRWTRATPKDWFLRAQREVSDPETGDPVTWVWDIPPSAAEHILEELALARLKRHDSMRGIVIVPGLMRPYWFRRFSRTVDAYFTIPVGSDCWPTTMHEPLIIGLFFPLLRYRPWDWKCSPALVAGVRKVQSLYKTDCIRGRDLLRELWLACLWVQVWQPKDEKTGEVIEIPGEETRFLQGRPGDHLICPFECDLCCFQRLFKRDPIPKQPGDDTVLDFIRRANLDAFWSRAPATVEASRRSFVEQTTWAENLGFAMFDPRGPLPQAYDPGLRTAMAVLHKSTQPGRHESTQKFSSARKARVVHTNMFKTSAKGICTNTYGRVDARRIIHGDSPVDSEFYTMFTKGFEYRVGQRVRRDMAVSIEVMCMFEDMAEKLWNEIRIEPPLTPRSKREIAEWACYFSYAFCHSLRGFEVVKATLKDLRKQIGVRSGEEYLGLPMLGRFKNCGNTNVRMLCFMVGRTASGLEPVKWTRRLLEILDQEALVSDWLFQDPRSGHQRKMSSFAEVFYEFLGHVQQTKPDLIPDDIEVTEEYFLGRSFRRGATTRAQNAGVSEPDVNWVNRWGTGTELVVKGPMRVIYSERSQLLDTYLRFSRAL